MRAKAKGVGWVGKYHFGEYGIISSEPSWVSKKGSKVLYVSKGSSDQEISFVFTDNKSDTISVYASVDSDFKRFEIGVGKTNKGNYSTSTKISFPIDSEEHFVAYLSPRSDTSRWKLVAAFFIGKEVKGNFAFYGSLTDGSRIIEIRPVNQWSNGKTAYRNDIIGFEFVANEICLAAVQNSGNTFHKKFIWLKNDLCEDLKLILAASAATLLVVVDGQDTRLDD